MSDDITFLECYLNLVSPCGNIGQLLDSEPWMQDPFCYGSGSVIFIRIHFVMDPAP